MVALRWVIGDNRGDMTNPSHDAHDSQTLTYTRISRRSFALGTAVVSLSFAARGFSQPTPKLDSKRILVGSGTPDGILAFGWDGATGTLTPQGIAAGISHSTWLGLSPDRRNLYVACELDEFQGKPTGAVARS